MKNVLCHSFYFYLVLLSLDKRNKQNEVIVRRLLKCYLKVFFKLCNVKDKSEFKQENDQFFFSPGETTIIKQTKNETLVPQNIINIKTIIAALVFLLWVTETISKL